MKGFSIPHSEKNIETLHDVEITPMTLDASISKKCRN
jgi:hypothetical protein